MTQLSPDDWILAGLDALAAEGIAGLKVERLAKTLGVSKGSFYWHFTGRPALLEAMRTQWEQRATHDVIRFIDNETADPEQRLRTLLSYSFVPEGFDRVDVALRVWGMTDPQTAEVCQRVDQSRIAYVTSLLKAMGFTTARAKQRATLLYMTLIGHMTWIQAGGRPLSMKHIKELANMLVQNGDA